MSNLSFNYSKWDKLEISDDEETYHPNLDTGLNIRVNRITRDRKEEEIDEEKSKLEAAGKFDAAAKLEDRRPLHVNNICHVAEERTIIHSNDGSRKDTIKKGEEFCVDEYSLFKDENQKLLDTFTNASWEESRDLLMQRGEVLMHEYASTYYMLTALDEEMNGNAKRVEKLCRQGQIISQIHQLAEPLKRPPRDFVPRFFQKFDRGNSEAMATFEEGVNHWTKNLKQRAVDKRKEQEAAAAEEDEKAQTMEKVSLVEAMYQMSKEERMGPGGLDPVEVFESLPTDMQECFKSGDIPKLREVAAAMPEEEFSRHFQRCIDGGLWQKQG